MKSKKETDDSLSKIKEIILGGNLKAFAKEIKSLKKEMQTEIENLHGVVVDSENALEAKLSESLNDKTNANSNLIREKVSGLEEHHHELIYRKYEHARASIKKFKTELSELQKKQNNKIDALKKAMDKKIQTEVSESLKEIKQNYVSKESLSKLLATLSDSIN